MQDNQFTNVGKMQKRYIDAERTSALIQSRLDGLEFMKNKDKAEGYEMAICAILRIIEHSSATDIAEVRHGEWEYIEDECICSLCSGSSYTEFDYCPNCGSKMDVKSE